MNPSQPAALSMVGIDAAYGDTVVLRSVTLTVPPSSVVALVGSNGAGKTTLLRIGSGLLRPRRGSVLLDSRDVTTAPPYRRVRLGLCHVPDTQGVYPSLSVRENIALQARRGQERDAIDLAVDAFPALGRRLDHRAGSLSGGEQRMLAVARTYIRHPRVALLDELSLGLAPKVVDEIFSCLQGLARQGVALLIVEQYVNRVLDLADYVYVLSKGRVSFVGEPSELDQEFLAESYLRGGQSEAAAMQQA